MARFDEPYRRPTREEIAERVRARDAMMPGPDWLWRQELAEEFGGAPEPEHAPPREVSRCGACGYLTTAVGHKIACG